MTGIRWQRPSGFSQLSCCRKEGLCHVLDKDIEGEISAVRARQNRRLPVVLTVKEQECLQLRIKDVDFKQDIVIVLSGKEELLNHLNDVRVLYEKDRKVKLKG